MTREEAKDYIREWCPYDRQEEIIKALEQQPCDDCISREEALMALTGDITDCTIEEFIARLRDKLSKLPSVGKDINVTTNEDCISRQAVLDEINRIGIKAFETYNDYSELYDFVDGLPFVTPKEKTGWIPISERLPEIGTDVLTCDMEGIIYLSHRTPHNNYFYAWGDKIKDIIAWMPLPAPMKEGD